MSTLPVLYLCYREEFEGLAGDFFQKAAAPLTALLQRNPESAKCVSWREIRICTCS